MSTKLLSTKTYTLNHFEQTVHEQACHLQEFLSSTSDNHLNNSTLVRTHPCCICWKSCITFSSYPSLTCLQVFDSIQKCSIEMCLGAFAAISAATHGRFCKCLSQSDSRLLMFEIWVSFICLLQPIKLDSHVCILHIPGIKKYHKNKQSCTDLFHQHTAFTYLLEPTATTIPPVQRTWKEFLPSLDQGRIDSNQESEREKATRLTPKRAARVATLTCELWQVWCSVTFSDRWSHHCKGSKTFLEARHAYCEKMAVDREE